MGYIWKIGRHHYTAPKINTIFIEPYFNTCIYFTYMKSNLNIFTCSETDLKPASQYCHCSVSNEQENTTRIAQYLVISHSSSCEKDRDHETLRCLYPAGCIVKSFQAFTQQKRTKYVLPREVITL